MMGSFDGDLFFEEYGGEDGSHGVDGMGAPRSHSFDMRIAPGDGRFPQAPPLMDVSQQGKRDSAVQDYQGMMRGGMGQPMYNPFQAPVQLGGEVDMSEYDAVAASLHSFQASGSGVRSNYFMLSAVLSDSMYLFLFYCRIKCSIMDRETPDTISRP
jgi:hypothetical protein